DGGRRYSESGRGDPSRATRKPADVLAICWLHLSCSEHSAAPSRVIELRADAVLPRGTAGRVSSWRWLAASVARANCTQSFGQRLFLARLVVIERDADQGVGSEARNMNPKDWVVASRLWPLFLKEMHQLRRNRRLVVMLIIPPVLNIILFGFTLNPTFENLRLGVVDDCRTTDSRELVSAFKESLVFNVTGYYTSRETLGRMISEGVLDAGILIPREFSEKQIRGQSAGIQLLVDAVNANTATIAGAYAQRIVSTVRPGASLIRTPAKQSS